MDKQPEPPKEENDVNALEDTSGLTQDADKPASGQPSDGAQSQGGSEPIDTTKDTGLTPKADNKPAGPPPKGFFDRFRFLNIYLLMFFLLLAMGGAVVVVAYSISKRESTTSNLSTQTLNSDTLKQLASTDATVGNSSQVLNVESSAIFAGKVLVRQGAQVAGSLEVGSNLSATEVAATGNSVFGSLQVTKDLSVTGNTAVQGLTVQKSLNVNSGGTFSGPLSAPQITISTLQLNGDLVLTRHITAGGPSPSRSNGTALGGGGTTSVSGSDTSGTVSVNTGSGPAAGCFATITFAQRFNAIPHVIITPVGSSAGGLSYYVNRNSSSFSICTTSTPPSGANFAFDYLVLD